MTITEKQKFILRREPRYKVADNKRVPVTLEVLDRHDGSDDGDARSEGNTLTAELVDISRNGARLSLSEAIPAKSRLRLEFKIDRIKFDWIVEANANWVRPRSAQSWWVGCAFEDELPENVLLDLAFAGFLNRRLDPRQGVTVNLSANQQTTNGETHPVRLENFSAGGFRLFSPDKAEVGKRTLLQFDCPDGERIEIPADIRWQLESDGGQFIGCSFVNKEGYVLLVRAMRRLSLQEDTRRVPRRRWRPWLWVGMLSAAASYVLLSWLF